MIKEVKYLFFILIILIFIFFVGKYYFSDLNKKKSFRSEKNISQKVDLYSKNLPILMNDTFNIIEYTKNTQTKKKKKFSFWELIGKDD